MVRQGLGRPAILNRLCVMLDTSPLAQIKKVVGPTGWTDDPAETAPWLEDSRAAYHGACALMVRPANTEEVAEVVRICHAHDIPIVPQGGNTGRCGGATPDDSGAAVLLNLSRMNRIRGIDPADFTITVEAGCILQDVQDAAAAEDRLFPLSLGAEGTCQIGGNLATNAGGINVVRYGNARDLVLGLEVVLPDGEIWTSLKRLRKDNTGYDLRNLFVGSEGTLGIITAAVLKLFPRPTGTATAYIAVETIDDALALFARSRDQCGETLTSFELIAANVIESAVQHIEKTAHPLNTPSDWVVLLELSGNTDDAAQRAAIEQLLADAMEQGLILDAVIAQSEQQRNELWFIREAVVEAQKFEGANAKTDVSVPISSVPLFIRRAHAALAEKFPGVRPFAFGHVGDGNIHYNICQPLGGDAEVFRGQRDAIVELVHGVVRDLDGSISAEHGIGQLKRDALARFKPALDLRMMRQIKAALDPKGLMNPGKLL